MEPIGRMMTNLERLDFYQGADFEDTVCPREIVPRGGPLIWLIG